MHCPQCQSPELKVIDSRAQKESIKRRRCCISCGYRFTTFERIEKRYPMIRKKSGELEEFASAKVRQGLLNAFRKINISSDDFETLLARIDFEISSLTVSEITSKEVGELILSKIQLIDKVAYLRFASVYRDVQTIEEFVALLPKDDKSSANRTDSGK